MHIIKNLINKVIKFSQTKMGSNAADDINKDNVTAVALHCLKPLVHDSCLWIKTQEFLQTLIEICFDNMSVEDWNIR